jgi:hypothetical protein
MKRSLPAFLFLLFCGLSAKAQLTSCAQTLRYARATYDQGRLHEIPTILGDCLAKSEGKDSFTKEERVEAYKLLCLTYIYLEEPAMADEAMLNLLRTDHYFETRPNSDPAEFIALYNTFRTHPIYRLGLKVGANATQPNVVSYLPSNGLESEYKEGISFQAGLTADIPFAKNLTLNPDLFFTLKNFTYTNTGTYTEIASGDEREFTTESVENHTWISLPISVQYQFMDNKFNPYVSGGVSTEYLLGAKNTYSRAKEKSTSLNEKSESVKDNRQKINMGAIVSAGIKYKVSGGFLNAEFRFNYGFTKLNEVSDLYSNLERTNSTNGYVDGIFKLNTLSFTIGYVYNIFDPVKLKK